MSNGDLLIAPLVLDPADFPPLPLQPGFSQLVNDELGNAATPTDGFDEVFAEVVAIVDALDSALGTLAGELLDAFGEADTIDAQPVSVTADSFTASLAPSDTAVGNLGTLLGAAAAPTPPAPACDISLQAPDTAEGATPVNYALTLRNGTAAALNVTNAVFTPAIGSAAALSATVPVPQTLAPGADLQGHITVTPTTQGTFTGTLTLTVAGAARDTRACYTVRVVPAVTPPPPGGGGSPAPCVGLHRATDLGLICP
jgi:hypothetical protein